MRFRKRQPTAPDPASRQNRLAQIPRAEEHVADMDVHSAVLPQRSQNLRNHYPVDHMRAKLNFAPP
jgi:hypothetical protein